MATGTDAETEVDALVRGLPDGMLMSFLWDVLHAPVPCGETGGRAASGARRDVGDGDHSAAMS